VGDVLCELLAGQQAELSVVGDAAGHGLLVVAREQRAQGALPGDDQGEHEAAVHVEVGEDAEHAEDVGAQLVALVEHEHEHGLSAFVVNPPKRGAGLSGEQQWRPMMTPNKSQSPEAGSRPFRVCGKPMHRYWIRKRLNPLKRGAGLSGDEPQRRGGVWCVLVSIS